MKTASKLLALFCLTAIVIGGGSFVANLVIGHNEEEAVKQMAQDFVESIIPKEITVTGYNKITAKCKAPACKGRTHEVEVWLAYEHDRAISFPKKVWLGGGLGPILAEGANTKPKESPHQASN